MRERIELSRQLDALPDGPRRGHGVRDKRRRRGYGVFVGVVVVAGS